MVIETNIEVPLRLYICNYNQFDETNDTNLVGMTILKQYRIWSLKTALYQ